ncbi:MAG: cell filamentation protein Fic [Cellulomonadaceae bacterium]|nr:cell filamentation protein Fic [Cellulomonadaceae bacterium]
MPAHPLEPLAALPGVVAAVDEARQACETLRWHRALRRQWPVARTEAGVRAAWACAVVDGVRFPVELVRDVARGAAAPPGGADGDVLTGALRVQAAVERHMTAPGATSGVRVPFGQLVAGLHVAATGRSGEPEPVVTAGVAGRPRADEPPRDLRGLGPAPSGGELVSRLAALGDLLAAPSSSAVPALVTAAVVHGEVLALRPFTHGNGAVARGLFRHLITLGGVDPVGVVVPDVLWADEPALYLSTAARFSTGTAEGVALWLRYCAASVVRGAQEGTAIADAVVLGRIGSPAEPQVTQGT